MRVRAQDENGDYTFGRGSANFLVNSPEAVSQLIQTNLKLARGTWFLDSSIGTPWSSEILGYGTTHLYDLALRAVVLKTQGVREIVEYVSDFDRSARTISVTMTVASIFGDVSLSVAL